MKSYLAVHGLTMRDAFRLYAGYGASAWTKMVRPGRPVSVGARIPGGGLVAVSLFGFGAYVRPGTNDLDLLAHHEPRVLEWFRVLPGETMVDVGAHIGRYTLLAARHGARVVSLEPDPDNFSVLEANVALNGFRGVSLHPVAASNEIGHVELVRLDGTNRGMSAVRATAWARLPTPDNPHAPIVPRAPLDQVLAPLGMDRVDWLKIDVEGHEVQVLEGAPGTLRRTQRLILEVSRGHEEACRSLLEGDGFRKVAEEPGFPTCNWFLVRR